MVLNTSVFAEMNEQEQFDVNGGNPVVIGIAVIVVIGIGCLALGIYNGYKNAEAR